MTASRRAAVLPSSRLVPFTYKAKGRVGDYRWAGGRLSGGGRVRDVCEPGWVHPGDAGQRRHTGLRALPAARLPDARPGRHLAKYLVLREELVDKLELIINDLAEHGHPDAHVVIMSGFRTPEYNAEGVGRRGGARATAGISSATRPTSMWMMATASWRT